MERMGKVLVVDDDKVNQRLIETILTPMGVSILSADNGSECIRIAERDEPDVVLLDIMMPGVDGFQVVQRLKGQSQTQMIPILMVTSLTDTQARIKALEAGADDFLSKPVDGLELQVRVRSLLKAKSYHDAMVNHQKSLETEIARKTAELRNSYQEIKTAHLDTIYRLARAAEYRDESTGGHIHRIGSYAALIARALGMSEEEVDCITYAAPLHDIGKIGIPDSILLKPGKLNAGEWEIMKKHTLNGAMILEGSTSKYIQMAQVIALSHHEKWGGDGYPLGLKGENIPLPGRITMIADVFDALRSPRPYKEAFSFEKSLALIKESEHFFDPAVFKAFFRNIDAIRAYDLS
jgi:putative two-component system response regulator